VKRVALISTRPSTSNSLSSQLADLLGRDVSVQPMSLEEGLPSSLEMDLVLVTGRGWAAEVIRRMLHSSNLLVTQRTIRRRDWETVMALPARTRVLVVHQDQNQAYELMTLFYELGARHLEMLPYYPGQPVPEQVDIAITSGELLCVPPGPFRVLDIGIRAIDAVTVMEAMTRLDVFDEAGSSRLLRWMAETMPRSQGLRAAVSWLARMRREHEAVLDHVQDAVVACDARGRISFFNRKAETVFGQRAGTVVGKLAAEVLPMLDLRSMLSMGHQTVDRLVQVGKADIMATCVVLQEGEEPAGVVATLRPVGDIWTAEERLRREAAGHGHRARFRFEDMTGDSEALQAVIRQAKRVAASISAILIQGETGVGKEVLAQAIHNASPRAPYPFVGVNCAALPESLLESELFGYEEGAFTGARRGGKPGLFEQAHRGTIFLDEVGDISPALQARLLRVLELHEVLRVGGTQVVPVNMRVIAATNRNLRELVDRGGFRADLYYRLAVMPLVIPPLRERKAEIPALFRSFLERFGYQGAICQDVIDALQAYHWPGNVRELRNCTEYAVAMADGPVTPRHLPETVLRVQTAGPARGAELGAPLLSGEMLFLLQQIAGAGGVGNGIGRRALASLAARAGRSLTEGEIRLRLGQLEAAGLVVQHRGRGGTRLTPAGEAAILAPYGH
jgi:sigma-54 dependent transcriptional regulator, acetoin dehydrogenase operon transcriptional activator AcoR